MARRLLSALFTLMLVTPLALQAQMGLHMRVDKSTNAADPDDVPDVSVEHVSNGIRVGTGPAVVLWSDDHTASRPYTLSGTFTLEEPSNHTNYYGFIYGGNSLDAENQNYMYFLIAQNGTYLVKHRAGEATHDIVAKTPNDVINKPGDDGHSVNRLEVRVGDTHTEFVVNGTVVETIENTGMAGRTDGFWGVRVNHVIPSLLITDLTKSN